MHIVVLQHLEAEHPGLLTAYLAGDGAQVTVVKPFAGEAFPGLDGVDGVIALGGPMAVWEETRHPWLADEKAFLKAAVREAKVPTLGISLGHQLMAVALGGQVQAMPRAEIGLFEIEMTSDGAASPLLYDIDATARVFQWHECEVVGLPEGARLLASSASCTVQAVRYGPAAFGVQFHFEMTGAMLAEVAADPAYADRLTDALGEDAGAVFARNVAPEVDGLARQSKRLYENFMGLVRDRLAG